MQTQQISFIGDSQAHLICTKNKTEGGVYCKATWQTKDLCVFVRKSCEQQDG